MFFSEKNRKIGNFISQPNGADFDWQAAPLPKPSFGRESGVRRDTLLIGIGELEPAAIWIVASRNASPPLSSGDHSGRLSEACSIRSDRFHPDRRPPGNCTVHAAAQRIA